MGWPSDLREGVERLESSQPLRLGQGNGDKQTAFVRDTLALAVFPFLQRMVTEVRRCPGRTGKDQRHRLSAFTDVLLVPRSAGRRVACIIQQLAKNREVPTVR